MAFTTVSQLSTKELRQLLRKHLSLSDEQVREADKPIPTGDVAFITVKLSNSQPVGSSSFSFDGEREIEKISDSLNSMLSINAYGPNAFGMLTRARLALKSSSAKSDFKGLGVGVLSISSPKDLTEIVGAGYESRALLELQLTHAHTIEIEQPKIMRTAVNAISSEGRRVDGIITIETGS